MKILLPLLALVNTTVAQDWPQFRGPTGDGHCSVANLPLKWSDKENIAWSVDLPGKGWSSPIIAGGNVYLTTAVVTKGDEDSAKADRSLRALCLQLADGKVVWDVEVFSQDGKKAPTSIHAKNGHASPTPIFSEGKLYVHFGHQGSACLQADTGKKLWENRDFYYEPQHGNGGSPVLEGGKLIFSCDGPKEQFVLALDATTGKQAWKFDRKSTARSKFAFSTPSCFDIGGRRQLITPGADVVNSLDPATGKEIWRVSYEGYSIVPKPLYGNGLIFVSTSFDTPDVLAIKPDGEGDLTEKNIVWELGQNKRTPKTCSMLLKDGLLYWVSDNGILSCADALTGDVNYYERIGGEFSASPILAGDRIYLLDEHGKASVVKTGKQFSVLAENKLDSGKSYASYAATDGTLLLRGETKLYAIRQAK